MMADASRVEMLENYYKFIEKCRSDVADFRLTPRAEPTAYARCFAIFGLHLIGADKTLEEARDRLVEALRRDVRVARYGAGTDVPRHKAYRQLLCFTLSALSILDALQEDPLEDLVAEQITGDIEAELIEFGALEGRAGSGNQAMFSAIFLLHMARWCNLSVSCAIDKWQELHFKYMNRFGFWGRNSGPTHLNFQNGYHQYEVFEFLNVASPREAEAMNLVMNLADRKGHFAPYPGGGGCFDYDGVFILTPGGRAPLQLDIQALLRRCSETICSEQGRDGGFCESREIRPRRSSVVGFIERIGSVRNLSLVRERLRYAVTLQRVKHDRIHTHWSHYSREWSESNLWDSWFRVLTVARIEAAFNPARASSWGFIGYPGIGWHPSVKRTEHWL